MADEIASFLNFECYSDPSRLLLSSGSWLGVAYAGINKQAGDTEAVESQVMRRFQTQDHALREYSLTAGTHAKPRS